MGFCADLHPVNRINEELAKKSVKTGHPNAVLLSHTADELSISRSLNHVGGLSVLLLLYPKIVELTLNMPALEAESFQVLALQSILRLRRTSAARGKEFASDGVASMLHKVRFV